MGALPGPGPDVTVLAWARYSRGGTPSLGLFQVTVTPNGQVQAVEGPLALREGWATFRLPAADAATGRPAAQAGPAILWAARRPEPDLVPALAAVQQALAGQVAVVLCLRFRLLG